MNEKIKQLALQAGITSNNLSDGNMSHNDLEKFAELIVRECAEICENYAEALEILEDRSEPADFFQGGVKSAARRNANAIKKHFGVEE